MMFAFKMKDRLVSKLCERDNASMWEKEHCAYCSLQVI